MSFGSLQQCTMCAAPPVCLMGSSQQSGECTCLTTGGLGVHLCSTLGKAVYPGAGELCGYVQDSSPYLAWSEMALVVCGTVINPVCTEVLSESQDTIFMAVGAHLRAGSHSRRLLGETWDESPDIPLTFSAQNPVEEVTPEGLYAAVTGEEWNHTAAPCSALAHQYKQKERLGPVDEAALHGCVYWRRVGRRIIADHNLSALEGIDTFLLSPDDFAAAMGQRGVVEALLRNPHALLSAALYSRWFKPVRAFFSASYGLRLARMVHGVSAELLKRAADAGGPGGAGAPFMEYQRELFSNPLYAGAGQNRSHSRRLMGAAADTHEKLRKLPFYAVVQEAARKSQASTRNASTGFAVAQSMARGGFVWKPFTALGPCPPASALASSMTQVARVLSKYYEEYAALSAPRKLLSTMWEAMPTIRAPPDSEYSMAGNTSARQLGGWVLDQGLRLAGLTRGDLATFFIDPCDGKGCGEANRWTLGFLIESATYCDFESVTFCSDYRRDVWTSCLLGVAAYLVLYAVTDFMGVAWVGAAAFYLIPLFVLWFSIGVSPRCLPMVPTCMLDAMVDAVKAAVPLSTAIPPFLLQREGTTVRSCTGIGLDAWHDPLVFVLCDAGMCDGWANTTSLGGLELDIGGKRTMQASPDVAAYRVCSAVMSINTVHALAAGLLGLAAASAAALALAAMAAPFASLLWQVAVYDHE